MSFSNIGEIFGGFCQLLYFDKTVYGFSFTAGLAQNDSAFAASPPVDPCLEDPLLPECPPVDPCIEDPSLEECQSQPIDPCIEDPEACAVQDDDDENEGDGDGDSGGGDELFG